jgi:hypothetical protein
MSFPQVASRAHIAGVAIFLTLAAAAPALAQRAQQADRIPAFVFDARGAVAMLKQSESTASSFGSAPEALPRRGIGPVAGLHVYPIHHGHFAFGLGGELLLTRASRQEKDAAGMPVGRAIRRRLESLSGQISFNFGHRNGWSYLSGGIGPVNFDTYLDGDSPDGLRRPTLNYGAGARWFNTDHLAFSVDMRFYATSPANPTLIVGERERQTVLVLSAGIAIK